MSNNLFKRNCAVLAQWYAGECKEELQLKFHGEEWLDCAGANPPQPPSDDYQLRIKPRTITVNGIEVPEPVRKVPNRGDQVCVADPLNECLCWSAPWENTEPQIRTLERGLIHLTKEAAQQHAEAMLAPSKRAES